MNMDKHKKYMPLAIFLTLLFVYVLVFPLCLQCHLTFSYVAFPFLLFFPAAETLDLWTTQQRELRSSLTDLRTHFGRRYAALGRTFIGTYTILTVWLIYLMYTLETCSLELAGYTTLLALFLLAFYAVARWRFFHIGVGGSRL